MPLEIKRFSKDAGRKITQWSIVSNHSKAYFLWECILFTAMLWNFFLIPMIISFQIQLSDWKVLLYSHFLTISCFALDLALTLILFLFQRNPGLCTSLNEEFRERISLSKIVIDSIALLSIFFFEEGPFRTMRLFFFLKIIDYNLFFNKTKKSLCLTSSRELFLSLLKFSVNTLIFAHLLACGWHAVAFFNKSEATWLDHYSLTETEWTKRYLKSFHLGLSALCVSGAFEINFLPANDKEAILAILATPLAPLWLFYLFQTAKRALPNEEKDHIR